MVGERGLAIFANDLLRSTSRQRFRCSVQYGHIGTTGVNIPYYYQSQFGAWSYYQASPAIRLRKLIKELEIDYGQYFFVDFGSGKGRTLLIASEFPFKQVLGLEFAEELHKIATKNISIYPNKICRSVHSIHQDVTNYKFPDENMVLYFYNPFDITILSKIVQNIQTAAENYGRSIYIIYYFLPSHDHFKQLTEFRLLKISKKFVVYKSI